MDRNSALTTAGVI